MRKISLEEASIGNIAQGQLQRWVLDLPLDEPAIAARRYLGLGAPEVQAAFMYIETMRRFLNVIARGD